MNSHQFLGLEAADACDSGPSGYIRGASKLASQTATFSNTTMLLQDVALRDGKLLQLMVPRNLSHLITGDNNDES